MVNVGRALQKGRREALEALADQLAAELDAATSTRDSLPIVRALLATIRQLDELDEQARRQAALAAPPPEKSPVDELLSRRARHAV